MEDKSETNKMIQKKNLTLSISMTFALNDQNNIYQFSENNIRIFSSFTTPNAIRMYTKSFHFF